MEKKIPKIIHYCWFGPDELPQKSLDFIQTWKNKCPDYKIMFWNEHTYDVFSQEYTKSAYNHEKWAFVSDYVRLAVLKKYGGIYLDTDVEVVRSLDKLLNNSFFTGLEDSDSIATGLILGAVPNNNVINDLLMIYDSKGDNLTKGEFVETTCVEITTTYFKRKGFKFRNKLQVIDHSTIYPTIYFCPQRPGTNKIKLSPVTYTIHHYSASWLNTDGWRGAIRYRLIYWKAIIRKLLRKIVGETLLYKIQSWYRSNIKTK